MAWIVLSLMALLVASCGDDVGDATPEEPEPADAAVAEQEDEEPEVTTIRTAYVQGFGSLPVHVAQEEGFFADNGLEVEETPGTDFSLWVQGLDRQFDIVLSIGAISLGAITSGIDIVGISGMAWSDESAPNNPILTKDEEIQSITDLVGKRVGVLNVSGTVAESILYLVNEAGLDPNDVTLVTTPFPEMGDQMEAGQLDAASLAIPFDSALLAQGYHSIGDPVVEAAKDATGRDASANAFFVSTRTFAEENPDVIQAWRTAMTEAIDWIDENDAEARALLVDWLGVPEEVAEGATLPLLSSDLTVEGLEVFQIVGEAQGSLTQTPDLEGFVWQ